MLLVKTKLSSSPIHGLGVFADEFIPCGKKIGQLVLSIDRKITKFAFSTWPSSWKAMIKWYGYREGDYYYLNADDMRFFNHSDTPNTQQEGKADFAIRDIQPGEELTCNYYSFDDDASFKLSDLQTRPSVV